VQFWDNEGKKEGRGEAQTVNVVTLNLDRKTRRENNRQSFIAQRLKGIKDVKLTDTE